MKQQPRPLSPVFYAEPSDSEDLFRFLFGMQDEIDGGRADVELLATSVRNLAHRVGGTALIVRGMGGGIEGSIGLRAEHTPLSRVHYLRSIWLIVTPEARNTGHAKSLVIAAQALADQLGRRLTIEEFGTPEARADRDTGEYRLRFQHADRRVRFLGRHLQPVGIVFNHLPAVAAE